MGLVKSGDEEAGIWKQGTGNAQPPLHSHPPNRFRICIRGSLLRGRELRAIWMVSQIRFAFTMSSARLLGCVYVWDMIQYTARENGERRPSDRVLQ